MSKYKDMMKNGWHPEKPGTSLKGQVSGMLGRKKSDDGPAHVARPLSDLRDPTSFDAPPKRRGTGLIPAPPPTSTARKVITAPSKYQDPRGPPVAAPVGQKQLTGTEEPEEEVYESHEPQPYRVNTTGLATSALPPPPGRRDGADGRAPPSYQAATGVSPSAPPSLPPRLPPRTNSANSAPSPSAISPASTGNSGGFLNQGAVNRLGASGVSVPGLGIGRSSPAATSTPNPPQPPRPNAAASASHMGELQNRFGKLRTSSTPDAANAPSEGTTWAQKQAALKTAQNFQKDPSSVSFSDAKAAASTANNFRQRHGEQVASGVQAANGLNQKYGVMDKVGGFTGRPASGGGPGQIASPAPASPVAGLVGKKKPPPPPPKKKPGLGGPPAPSPGAGAGDEGPPPIPLSTRPQF